MLTSSQKKNIIFKKVLAILIFSTIYNIEVSTYKSVTISEICVLYNLYKSFKFLSNLIQRLKT